MRYEVVGIAGIAVAADEEGHDWDPSRPLREQWPWNGEARITLLPVADDRIIAGIGQLGSEYEPPAGYEERVLAEVHSADEDGVGDRVVAAVYLDGEEPK